MSRHLARFLGYTAGYLVVVAAGRAYDRLVQIELERQGAELVDLFERAEKIVADYRPRQRCLCTVCERGRAA